MRRAYIHALQRLEDLLFSAPRLAIGCILLTTGFFALQLPRLQIYSDLADLLPQSHPYIQLHNQIRDTFGGASLVVVGVEVESGTIFTNDALGLIHRLTQAADSLPSVNHNLVSSLTHRTTRKVAVDETGSVTSRTYYDPARAALSDQELEQLRKDVQADPRIFGFLVSPDMKGALIRAQLNEDRIDYKKIIDELQKIRVAETRPGVKIYATGQPVLIGWVYTYLPQILQIFLYTLGLIVCLLLIHFRSWYGVLLPLVGILLSTIWGLGFVSLLSYNLDPLNLVIPFLIAARATSHGVQLVERFYGELAVTRNTKEAARRAFDNLFRPGSIAIVVDAVGILVIALGAAPINTKLGYYAAFWAFSVIFTVLLLIPLLLAVLPQPQIAPRDARPARKLLTLTVQGLVGERRRAAGTLVVAAILLAIGGYYALRVEIGEAEPGSPILHRDHDYNVSTRAINYRFPGSEELYIVARSAEKGGLRNPEVLHQLESFQGQMSQDTALGGSKAIPGLIRAVNRLTHNDDPRWTQLPDSAAEVGGLLFAFMGATPIPGALKEFINADETDTNMVFYYKDHQAQTTRTAIKLASDWIAKHSGEVQGLSFHLAGGIVGLTAARNDAVYQDQLVIIPLVLLFAFVFVTAFYSSIHAGWLMVLPMMFATVLTYAYMGLSHTGVDVNTVPVIAVGIGVGIDYAIYIMSRIREEHSRLGDLRTAVRRAIFTTGYAVIFTASTLIAGVVMWVFFSDLRFQSDSALLLSVMLVLNAIAAMVLVPAWVVVYRPRFITDTHPAHGTTSNAPDDELKTNDVVRTRTAHHA